MIWYIRKEKQEGWKGSDKKDGVSLNLLVIEKEAKIRNT